MTRAKHSASDLTTLRSTAPAKMPTVIGIEVKKPPTTALSWPPPTSFSPPLEVCSKQRATLRPFGNFERKVNIYINIRTKSQIFRKTTLCFVALLA